MVSFFGCYLLHYNLRQKAAFSETEYTSRQCIEASKIKRVFVDKYSCKQQFEDNSKSHIESDA